MKTSDRFKLHLLAILFLLLTAFRLSAQKNEIVLTQEEIDWIEGHETLLVANETDL